MLVWLAYEQPVAVCSEGIIIRKPHHCDFPTRQGENPSRITETEMRSTTTTSQHHSQIKFIELKIKLIKLSFQALLFSIRLTVSEQFSQTPLQD